jgi:transcriptional regulator with XRE-family HTH domain
MCTFASMNNRIKEVIKQQGLTQKELAERLGMSRENLARIIASPSYATLEKLSAALQVPVWEFFMAREEVIGHEDVGQVITCPRCGAKIQVRTEVKD